MTAYHHAGDMAVLCGECADRSVEQKYPTVCADPQPDPASPCGYRFPSGIACGYDSARHGMWRNPRHTHQPTRCLNCHHALEADRA